MVRDGCLLGDFAAPREGGRLCVPALEKRCSLVLRGGWYCDCFSLAGPLLFRAEVILQSHMPNPSLKRVSLE